MSGCDQSNMVNGCKCGSNCSCGTCNC
ncbi:half metallothionein [Zostera marina]|uniref:half Metallothionein n=1 Tax=Zostera marina TaxID=29655 RepID=A0A0K9P2Z9_ZOSMR|nr:Half Metallothionein [Zostera marina]KMZ75123.1 half metallothionein [Zostera marina]